MKEVELSNMWPTSLQNVHTRIRDIKSSYPNFLHSKNLAPNSAKNLGEDFARSPSYKFRSQSKTAKINVAKDNSFTPKNSLAPKEQSTQENLLGLQIGLQKRSIENSSIDTIKRMTETNPKYATNNYAHNRNTINTYAPKHTMNSIQKKEFSPYLEQLIQRESTKQGVSPELIKAMVQVESNGKQRARSHKGAIGLMQLMPKTAKELQVNPFDPQENIRGGVYYIRKMAEKFQDLDSALAAYNAGPNAVKSYGAVPPYKETREYISKIRKLLQKSAP